MMVKLYHDRGFRAARCGRLLERACVGMAAFAWGVCAHADTILGSKHDLSVAGPGTIKAATESEVCIFCHTPHRAVSETPLWNHALSSAAYTPYDSSTLQATVGQPTGSSKLCLSCHDGTVALGMVVSRFEPIQMRNGVVTMPPGRSNLGTDLSGHHPVSFTFNSALAASDGQLRDPGGLTDRVRLDHDNQMQCTSCHDPHNNRYGKFLVEDNTASALCLNCHSMTQWAASDHRNSTKTWNGAGLDPWPNSDRTTVLANACENCHLSHKAGTPERLLTHALEEQNCDACHNGNVASKNITAEFNKPSVHPILSTTGVHDPVEDTINPPRHVECVDCHNPHSANGTVAMAPNASGSITGVRGVNAAGQVVLSVSREYELCFRCHADSIRKGSAVVPRQYPETNTRLEFGQSATSYHPVVSPGRNPNVPSLVPPYTTGSFIYCTDCHNNNQGPGARGTGPSGPHGSLYSPLLERRLEMVDNTTESDAAYALCYKCHNRSSILGDESFKAHRNHIVEQGTACTTCHDSHGVAGKTHLINFNPSYVTAAPGGRLEFVDQGTFRGQCYLTCHGVVHNPKSYSP